MFQTFDGTIGKGRNQSMMKMSRENRIQSIIHERGFTASTHARDASPCAKRNAHINTFQIMSRGIFEFKNFPISRAPFIRQFDIILT
jgi:hypothetical protein